MYYMYICFIILLLFLFVIFFIISSKREFLGFPFNSLTSRPESPIESKKYVQPYCTDYLCRPVKCPKPCGELCRTCKYYHPIPVEYSKIGAYSPYIWCPGPPLC